MYATLATFGFFLMLSVIALLDLCLDKYLHRSELRGF